MNWAFAKFDYKKPKIPVILLTLAALILTWLVYLLFFAKNTTIHQPAAPIMTLPALKSQPAAAEKSQAARIVMPAVKPVDANQPAVIKKINLQLPTAEHKQSLLPLQQPMIAFPSPAHITSLNSKKITPAFAATTQVTSAFNKEIIAVDPNFYTIQLTSDHELENLQHFIVKHNLQKKVRYFHTYNKQKRKIYTLIYGQYTTLAEAKAALAELPVSAKEEGAFVIKYASIQALLQKPAPAGI